VNITPLSVIKDGGRVYEPGADYEVDEEIGQRFVTLGWATSPEYVTNSEAGVDVAGVAPNSVRHTTAGTEG
jgi:hypothetical protein